MSKLCRQSGTCHNAVSPKRPLTAGTAVAHRLERAGVGSAATTALDSEDARGGQDTAGGGADLRGRRRSVPRAAAGVEPAPRGGLFACGGAAATGAFCGDPARELDFAESCCIATMAASACGAAISADNPRSSCFVALAARAASCTATSADGFDSYCFTALAIRAVCCAADVLSCPCFVAPAARAISGRAFFAGDLISSCFFAPAARAICGLAILAGDPMCSCFAPAARAVRGCAASADATAFRADCGFATANSSAPAACGIIVMAVEANRAEGVAASCDAVPAAMDNDLC